MRGIGSWFIAIGMFVLGGSMLMRSLERPAQMKCTFDRNEPRKGEAGDGLDGKAVEGWWWDIYKCSDGTERRQLVAGPRG